MTEAEIAEVVRRVMSELQEPSVTPMAVNTGMFSVAPGQTILADHMNSALQTGVAKFANAAARTAQWPAPPTGAVCYMQDTNYFMVYDPPLDGSVAAWRVFGTYRMGIGNMGVGQAIANNVHQPLTFSTVTGAANRPGRATWAGSEITVPLQGVYLFTADICWPDNANGERRFYAQRYNAGAWGNYYLAGGVAELNKATVGTTYLRQAISGAVHCYAGEKLRFLAYQSSGVTLTLLTAQTDLPGAHLQFLGAD